MKKCTSTRWATKKQPAFRSARVFVIISLALVCILCSVFEQLVNGRVVTMLTYTRCNIMILMGAAAWLMLSFRHFSLGTLEKYGIRIKFAHDMRYEGHHQPRSCSHQNHYVTSGIPQHDQTCAAVC